MIQLPIERASSKSAAQIKPSTWRIVLFGAVAAIAAALSCFAIASMAVRASGWALHPDISGSTMYFLGVFIFELFFVPPIFIVFFAIVLPIIYGKRKETSGKPISFVPTTIVFLVLEAAYLALLLFGMESFGYLFGLNFGLIAVATILGNWFIISRINASLAS
jgi:hypothetical protein